MIVYIYKDPGASSISAKYLKFALSMALQDHNFDVRFISGKEIKDGKLSSPNVKMFVLGGGGFTDVKKNLGSEGIKNIQNFVHAGGQYCGVCMGSWGALGNINFNGAEAKSNTGLGFYNAIASGTLPITAPYDGTAKSATILEIQHLKNDIKMPALYWGGNGMDEHQLMSIGAEPLSKTILPNKKEKIVSAKINIGDNGGAAFACGYHFEAYERMRIWNWVSQFANWGEDLIRLKNELHQHAPKSYLMPLACALDDIGLVKDHSFVQTLSNRAEATSPLPEKPAQTNEQAFPYNRLP